MKRFSPVCLLLLIGHFSFSQSDSLQKEINEQVWKPFIKAIISDNNEKLSAVHSKEVTRVIQDDNQILGYNEYFKKIPDSIKAKWKDWKRDIELRFLQRIASAEKAFEVGYYKTSSTNAVTGEKRIGYGKFHVLLRKETGTWKIQMDADANEKTDEAMFLKAMPME